MTIGPIESTPIRPERTDGTAKKAGEAAEAPSQTRRTDRVEISAQAREAAAKLGEVPGLSPERVAQIRQKLADGSYNSAEVVETVARRMIQRGDV